jgi:hypothetical protein
MLKREELVDKLISSDLADPKDIQGCSDDEVRQIEAAFNLRLPQAYKVFLSSFGKKAGALLDGSDYLYPALLDCRRTAEKIIADTEARFQLSPQSFVFLQHEGYQFLFFDTDKANQDPPVFRFIEGDSYPSKIFDTFSDWLSLCIEQEAELYAANQADA